MNIQVYIMMIYQYLVITPWEFLQGLNTLFSLKGVDRPALYLRDNIEVYKYDTDNFYYVMIARTHINILCDKIETLSENIRNMSHP